MIQEIDVGKLFQRERKAIGVNVPRWALARCLRGIRSWGGRSRGKGVAGTRKRWGGRWYRD